MPTSEETKEISCIRTIVKSVEIRKSFLTCTIYAPKHGSLKIRFPCLRFLGRQVTRTQVYP